MKPTKPTTLEIGTISHGTMRVQDTMPALLSALDGIRLSAADRQTCSGVEQSFDAWIAVDAEAYRAVSGPWDADDLLCDLEIEMNDTLLPLAESYVPDYCYVGSHPGDGSDLGVWVCEDLFDDTTQGSYDGYCFRSTESPWPSPGLSLDHSHWLQINDHGNATLYRRSGSRWTECWSIV